jgi:hypothetical protein
MARVSKPHGSSEPIKQWLPELAFEFDDLLAEGRLRHEAFLGGPSETAKICNGEEVPKLV